MHIVYVLAPALTHAQVITDRPFVQITHSGQQLTYVQPEFFFHSKMLLIYVLSPERNANESSNNISQHCWLWINRARIRVRTCKLDHWSFFLAYFYLLINKNKNQISNEKSHSNALRNSIIHFRSLWNKINRCITNVECECRHWALKE